MLELTLKLPKSSNEADYNLALRYNDNWQVSKKKVLMVFQTVDSKDLMKKEMLGDPSTRALVSGCVKEARGFVRAYNEKALGSISFAACNFNARKHLHLSNSAKREAEKEFAHRVHSIIQKLKPTHLLVSGDQAMAALFPNVQNSEFKRGWVHDLKSGNIELKVTSTLDLSRLTEKGGTHANLLGFWYRHLGHLILGKHPQDLSHLKVKPILINTLDKFDSMMRVLNKSKIVASDTETANLSVLLNKLYTIQFATELDPSRAFVVTVNHPLGQFKPAEINYIKSVLRAYFSTKEGETKKFTVDRLGVEVTQTVTAPEQLIFFNGMFDLRIIRRALKLPIIWHRVWEITAGEHLLDENISSLNTATGTKGGGLKAIFCSYGNDAYFQQSTFTKESRNNIANVDPSNKDFLSYAAWDVVSLLGLRLAQINRADHEDFKGENYKPYFVRHMLYQMSDTVHQLSHLKEDGSLVDQVYLKHLLSKDSPLRKELKIASIEMKDYGVVRKANEELIKRSGFKAKGLFGGASARRANWMFKIKNAHLKVLFFDVMGLKPVSQTPTGEDAVDKNFIEHYQDKHPVVQTYADYSALSKLLSTYVKGWYKKLTTDPDGLQDSCLRPDYSFWDVVTGRLASKNPSLQTIPARSKLAKIIKRMFITQKGYLLIRFDYSAHEVRMWSVVSGDQVLAGAFEAGQALRKKWIVDPSDENKKAIKEKGDVHIQNVLRFFKKLVDKSHPLRDAVKSVVFGVLYGKSAQSLGVDTKKGDIMAVKDKMRVLMAEIRRIEAL